MAAPVRKPRRNWRWHVPPALVHGNESLEGGELLEEFSGAAGLALWHSMRDATLWAGARKPEERAGLFHPGTYAQRIRQIEEAGLDAAIDAPLRALAAISRDPVAAREEDVLAACRDISYWGEGQGKLGTAIAVAQAGALVAPSSAAAALRVGQLARRRVEHACAESWFQRVIGLARRARDWANYAEAILGLEALYLQRGNVYAAQRLPLHRLRAARPRGMCAFKIEGRQPHEMFMLEIYGAPRANDAPLAYALRLARDAFDAYGPTHPRLPDLAYDLVYFWIQRGRFAQALSVLQGLRPHIVEPMQRMQVVADIGRAAGGAGSRAAFDEAWDELLSFAGDWYTHPAPAQAFLNMARGAASLKDWARAERATTTARDMAIRRKEARVVMEAEALLDLVSRKRNLETPPPTAPGAEEEAESDGLAADLIRALAHGIIRK